MIIFSDIHFQNHGVFARLDKFGLDTRFWVQIELLQHIFQVAEEGDEAIVFLGDLFQKWRDINTPLFSIVAQKVFELLNKNTNRQLIMVLGNHDLPSKRDTSISTMDALEGHKQITIIREPGLLWIEGMSCGFIPYHEDPSYTLYWIDQLHAQGVEYLFSHLDIAGASASIEGYVCNYGIDISLLQEKFKGGVFGHYHQPQSFHGNFHYVGSPIQLGEVDAGQYKGVISFKEGKPKQIWIDNPRFVPVNKYFGSITPQGLRLMDYHIVECEPSIMGDVRRWYESNGFKVDVRPTKTVAETSISRPDLRSDSVLQDYIQHTNTGLDADCLLRYGSYYLDRARGR